LWSGIQTSNRIAGFVVAATRQNAGRLPIVAVDFGTAKLPVEMVVAEVMTVSGSWRLRRSLQDSWAGSGAARRSRANRRKGIEVREFCTILLVDLKSGDRVPPLWT
jgi:hypothetical protein